MDKTDEHLSQSAEERIGLLLISHHLKLVTVESCTGGLLGHRITNIPGATEYYLGGFITYANAAKTGLVSVPEKVLQTHGAVSSETAVAMALGGRVAMAENYSNANIVSISITGVAGPRRGNTRKPVGLVWIGLAAPEGTLAHRFQSHGDRLENKNVFVDEALRILESYLSGMLEIAVNE